MTLDYDFMRLAIDTARKGVTAGQTPFGAVITKNGKVVAEAHNSVWKTTDPTAHAEINAIRLACKKLGTINLDGCVIYSTTEPCPLCFSAIHWARISKIVYGAEIADAKKAGFNELILSNRVMKKLGKSRVAIKGRVLKKENQALFEYWKKVNWKPY